MNAPFMTCNVMHEERLKSVILDRLVHRNAILEENGAPERIHTLIPG